MLSSSSKVFSSPGVEGPLIWVLPMLECTRVEVSSLSDDSGLAFSSVIWNDQIKKQKQKQKIRLKQI